MANLTPEKNVVKKLLANDKVRRVLHTLYQAAAGALVAHLVVAHNAAGVQAAVTAGVAAAISALKGLLVA